MTHAEIDRAARMAFFVGLTVAALFAILNAAALVVGWIAIMRWVRS